MSVHDADYKKVKKLLDIPDDEPIFILRGQDRLSLPIISRYQNLRRQADQNPPTAEWMQEVDNVRFAFAAFSSDHKDRMKVPD